MPRLLIYFYFERFDVAVKKCITLAWTTQKRQWPETLLPFQKQDEWNFVLKKKRISPYPLFQDPMLQIYWAERRPPLNLPLQK